MVALARSLGDDSNAIGPLSSWAATVIPFAVKELPLRFGRYELISLLGVGGMGAVYLGVDSVLQRRVAVKLPHRDFDPVPPNRLLSEARAAALIQHPNVCALYDIGCHADQPYLTMEYVDGPSLDRVLNTDGPMALDDAVALVKRIACGVDAAHRKGVVHRDLKPANILMRDASSPVITDFGLARRGEDSDRPTRLIGSPAYMAPEQIRCDFPAIGPATDVYGLGAVLYELITGRRPFDGDLPQVYSQVLRQPPCPPSQLVPAIGPGLDELCLRALAKSSQDRFDSVVEFGRELTSCIAAELPKAPVRRRRISSPLPDGDDDDGDLKLAPLQSKKASGARFAVLPKRGPLRERRPRSSVQATGRCGKQVTPRALALAAASCAVVVSFVVGAAISWERAAAGGLTFIQRHFISDRPIVAAATVVPSEPDFAVKDARSRSGVLSDPSRSYGRESIVAGLDISSVAGGSATIGGSGVHSVLNRLEDQVIAGEDKRPETPPAYPDQKTAIGFDWSESINLHDAIVMIDGKRVSRQRLDGPLRLSPGLHRVAIMSPEVETASRSFRVLESDERQLVSVPLVRRRGEIRVRIVRLMPQDRVSIDGRHLELRRLTDPLALSVGRHRLKVEREGKGVRRKTFWVIEGANPDLKLAVGSLARADRQITSRSIATETPTPLVDEWNHRRGELRTVNSVAMQMSWCPAPLNDVAVDAFPFDPHAATRNRKQPGFWIGRHEVTTAQWDLVGDLANRVGSAARSGHHPTRRTWREAEAFADELTKIERARGRLDANWAFRLPTIDQWRQAFATNGPVVKPDGNQTNASLPLHAQRFSVSRPWSIQRRSQEMPEWCLGETGRGAASEPMAAPRETLGFRLVLVRCD